MRKLFLFPALFLLVLASCKEDKGDPMPAVDISEEIKGTWVTTSQTHKYYDASDKLVYEETDETETVFEFDGSKVTATYDSGGGMSGTYTISKSGDKDYINLTESNRTERMEITNFTGTAMTWSTEKDNTPYFDNGLKTADHVVITIDFTKQ